MQTEYSFESITFHYFLKKEILKCSELLKGGCHSNESRGIDWTTLVNTLSLLCRAFIFTKTKYKNSIVNVKIKVEKKKKKKKKWIWKLNFRLFTKWNKGLKLRKNILWKKLDNIVLCCAWSASKMWCDYG